MAHEVTTSIEIAATPEIVWAVLADLPSYPRWHPVFLSVTGQLAVGSTLTIETTHPANGKNMTGKVRVSVVEPDTELRWVSKLAGVTISERFFQLSPSAGGTALVQAASYRGLGRSGNRVMNKTVTRIEDTFATINQAIKQQAEARYRAPG